MNRAYYLLPADFCKDALAKYQIAKDDAMRAKQEIMAKYGCVALLRAGSNIQGLAYEKYTDLSGFTVPKRQMDFWVIRPKKTTLRGKKAQQELDECGELLEIWQWALEHSLGVYGCVLSTGIDKGFHYLVAKPLKDGRVILDAPAGKNSPRGPNVSRNFDDPVIPACATPITEAEAKLRLQADALEQEAA